MKKILLLLIITLELSYSQTQNNINSYVTSTLIQAKQADENDVRGVPYFVDSKFTKGIIYDGDKELNNIPLRFNAYKDEVEVHMDDDQIYAATKKPAQYFMIYGKYLYFMNFITEGGKLKKGYLFCVECESKTSLFKRVYKEYHEKVTAKTGYQQDKPAEYTTIEQLYIRFKPEENAQPLESSTKKILDQFPDHQDELKNKVKQDKLNLKKEEDLARLINYYNILTQ